MNRKVDLFLDLLLLASVAVVTALALIEHGPVFIFYLLIGAAVMLVGILVGWNAAWDEALKVLDDSRERWIALGRADAAVKLHPPVPTEWESNAISTLGDWPSSKDNA